jgi:hypothetical protein
MTIPKRMNEIIEDQLAAKEAGWLEDALAIGATGIGALATVPTGGASDAAAAGIDAALLGTDAAATAGDAAATGAAADTAATSAADAASSEGSGLVDQYGKPLSSGTAAEGAPAADGTGGGTWSKLKGYGQGAIGALTTMGTNDVKNTISNALKKTVADPTTPYEGAGAGSSYRAGPMLTSSKKNAANNIEMEILDQVKDIPKLLEMILENLCNCGQPTAGKFNGMPHCTPGSGCANNVAFSPSNPTGDHCCSCGNPNCSGSFHGQPICAPGQGCNDHWDAEKGARKWSPAMETPAEKITDHDNWASSTNHGEFEMPDEAQTTWE